MAGQTRKAAQPPGQPLGPYRALQQPLTPPHHSPPTSPGSSKIDIHPFLKFSRSGYGERGWQVSQAQQEPKGLILPALSPTRVLGSQKGGFRTQITPQIQAGSQPLKQPWSLS